MSFEVIVPKTAKNEIDKKLDNNLVSRLNERIKKLKEFPDIFGKPLRSPLEGVWEIRFEKRWRILYEIDYQKNVVTIIGLKHKDEM